MILGDRVEVHAGTVLGGDGFGYRQVDGRHVKIPHTGRLEVENDVEIGSNCTIDRATFETTRIGEGTKIDNLVMIGHNNQIGRHNLLCGQVGIAGSCKTGDYVVMAGQAGIKDNTQIGDRRDRRRPGGRASQHPRRPERAGLAGDPGPRTAADLPDDRPAAGDASPAPRADRPARRLSLPGSARTRVSSLDGDAGFANRSREPMRPMTRSTSAADLARLRRVDRRSDRGVSAIGLQKPSRRADRLGRPSRSACSPGAAGFRSSSPRRRAGRACPWPASGSSTKRPTSCAALCDSFRVVGVAKLGRMIRAFRAPGRRADRHGGQGDQERDVHALADPPALPRPADAPVVVPPQPRRQSRRQSSCSRMIAEFERDGMTFASALDFCPELLVKEGILTRRAPTSAEQKDIEFGWTLAKEMGRLDVGQSVAVKEKAALAVEAIEGTDRCIERAGQLCRAGGWTLVKVAKPQQDMRFDVPTIGVTTIENLHKAGARVLAIEAGKTICSTSPRSSRWPTATA